MPKNIIVIGASTGGIEALRTLVAGLPRDLAASVFVVIHIAAESPGVLADILDRASPLSAVAVKSRMRLEPARIYVAAPDRHLIIEPGFVQATQGPKENRFRPAIDPLFRSAAQVYGPRAIGVILTGGLDDGTAGLWTIKQLGGTAIVQDPADAFMDSMPRNALQYVRVDYCVPLSQMASLLVRLVNEQDDAREAIMVPDEVKIEVDIAKEDRALHAGVLTLGEPSNYTCPECHGVLLQLKEGGRIRFRCHTGHAYAAESLLAEISTAIEDSLWNAVRTIEESGMLLRHLAQHLIDVQQHDLANSFISRAAETDHRINIVRKAMKEQSPPGEPSRDAENRAETPGGPAAAAKRLT
ncbi:MAG TPA: chemotaxis protein CheB [Burkholderiaceae bacterium]|nr:chemotaxis protein CheB [Burkholderiaceae bacterium]